MGSWKNNTMDYFLHLLNANSSLVSLRTNSTDALDYYLVADDENHDSFLEQSGDKWQRIYATLTPILVCVGIAGNIGSAFILSLSSVKFQPVSVFLTSCMVSDSFFLAGVFFMWMSTVGVHIEFPVQWCQFLSMLTNPSNFLSTWSSVAVVVEQYVATWSSFSVTCSPARARVCVLALTCVAVVVFSNLTVIMDAQMFGESIVCLPLLAVMHAFQVLYKVDLLVNILIPFAICTFVAVMYWCQVAVRRATVLFRTDGNQTNVPSSHPAPVNHSCTKSVLTMMLIVQTLPLPYNILRVIHTSRELLGWQYYVTDSDHLMQNVMQYVYNMFFVVKGYMLFAFWKEYRVKTCKILKRICCYSFRKINCKLWPQQDRFLAVWQKSSRVTFVPVSSSDMLNDGEVL